MIKFPKCLAAVPAVVLTMLLSVSAAPADDRPNVLLIAIDDLNDWVGCLQGHPQARTPHIDALADRGVNFTNAHCQAPICNCSRVSMFLSRQPASTGMYFLAPDFRTPERTRDAVTMFQDFRSHGYHVTGMGKVFHGRADPASFDHFQPSTGWRKDNRKRHYDIPGAHGLWDWGQVEVPDEQHRDYQTAQWAARQIPGLAEGPQPFVLAVGFQLPHVPIYASEKWFRQFPLEQLELPQTLGRDRSDLSEYAKLLTLNPTGPRHDWMVEHDEWRHAVQAYLAATSFVDSLIGVLLDELQQSAAADNTVIVVFSDHGFHLGEKQRWAKRTLWEDSTRVPLVIAGPEIPAGLRCSQPVGLIDVYPTLSDLCSLPLADGIQGHSLRPLLLNPETSWDRPTLTTFGPHNHAVRSRRWRYISYADGSQELYDHESDPHEWHNLVDDPQYADIIATHRRWLPATNADPLPGSRGSDSPLYGEGH